MFAQFPFAVRRFLNARVTVEDARQIVRERMARRESSFLEMLERNVYGNPHSPYLKLLKRAGCELGDVRVLVAQKNIEGALRVLRGEGVYVTFEEFKGRKPIERSGLTIEVTPRDFDNPNAQRHFVSTTGGSTGLASGVHHDLDHVAAGAVNHFLMLDAHNARDLPMAMWIPILPGGGFSFLLQRLYLQQPANVWYSAFGWRDSQQWQKYSAATIYMLACLYANGARAPFPKILRPADALTVARWLRETLDQHGRAIFYSGTSHALRVCLAAEQAGFNFEGAILRVGGEPITTAKVNVIKRLGARIIAGYGGVDTGGIGLSCAQPAQVDEVHLIASSYALITHPFTVPNMDVTVPAFNFTNLLGSAPKVMLNFQSDDYGVVSERACGCAIEDLGYTTHLHEIRSYSKLVGESVTMIGNEMVKILEEVLPARFGGSPLDYQMMEQEDAQGFTRLVLLVHPRLELANEAELKRVVMDALRVASPAADAARVIWQGADTLQIERREPISTARGKLLPLHISKYIKS